MQRKRLRGYWTDNLFEDQTTKFDYSVETRIECISWDFVIIEKMGVVTDIQATTSANFTCEKLITLGNLEIYRKNCFVVS